MSSQFDRKDKRANLDLRGDGDIRQAGEGLMASMTGMKTTDSSAVKAAASSSSI
jgi:hypothetical protein